MKNDWWYSRESEREKKMEFDKSRCYSALNADELRAGDKVIVADCMATLKRWAESGSNAVITKLQGVADETHEYRIITDCGEHFALAYLVERKENCTNCGSTCGYADENHHALQCSRCDNWQPKAEPKTTKKHYRPFKDTDELIKVWDSKHSHVYPRPKNTMPLIWVQNKNSSMGLDNSGVLITGYFGTGVTVDGQLYSMSAMLDELVFLDGSICGVEE